MLSRWPLTKGSLAKRLDLIVGPAVEPVGPQLQQTALKVNVNTSLFAIQARIAAARELVEERIHRRLVQQTWDLYLDDEQYVGETTSRFPFEVSDVFSESNGIPEIQLPYPPVQGVVGVWCTDRQGVEAKVDTSVYYVTKAKNPCRIRLNPGQSWPSHRGGEGIRIRFTCGYVTPFTISSDGTGIIEASNHGYNNGDTVRFSSQDGTLPAPLVERTNYTVVNLTGSGFQVIDTLGNLIIPDLTWTGTAFIGEIPGPLIEAVTMVSALNQSGEIPTRLPGGGSGNRLSPIELPVEPAELVEPFVWPEF